MVLFTVMKFSFLVNLTVLMRRQSCWTRLAKFIKDQGTWRSRRVGSFGFVVQLSYFSAQTTRHMHILGEANIKDEGWGGKAGNRDRLCALAEAQSAAG